MRITNNIKKSLVCIGSINCDVYEDFENYSKSLGGSACNTAYFLKLLLDPDKFIINLVGLIGNDENGIFVEKQLKIKTLFNPLIRILKHKSGTVNISVLPDGERKIKRINSLNAYLSKYFEEISNNKVIQNSLIHMKGSRNLIESIFLHFNNIYSSDISGIIQFSQIPKIKDHNYFKSWINETFQKRKRSIKILFGNEQEFSVLLKLLGIIDSKKTFLESPNEKKFEKLAEFFTIFHSKIICVKCGSIGAYCLSKNGVFFSRAQNIKVIDTTGAGDAFNAGFIYGDINHFSIQNSLNIGCILGSFNCIKIGAQSFFLPKEEFDQIVKNIINNEEKNKVE